MEIAICSKQLRQLISESIETKKHAGCRLFSDSISLEYNNLNFVLFLRRHIDENSKFQICAWWQEEEEGEIAAPCQSCFGFGRCD